MKQVIVAFAIGIVGISLHADPRVDNWYTKDSKKYARLYPTATDERNGNAVTTWRWGMGVQTVPVLAGVHDVSYSKDWVYIHTSGLASYVIGPVVSQCRQDTNVPELSSGYENDLSHPAHSNNSRDKNPDRPRSDRLLRKRRCTVR